jgi:pimeloyl-ACP methyl ester carboxylesterase
VDPAFVDAFMGADPAGRDALVAAKISVPTLLLTADPKESALADGEAERIAALGPVQVVRFPGIGHRIHGLRPEPFLEALEPFLRRMRAEAPATAR